MISISVSNKNNFILDTQKKSVKGVTYAAQQKLSHEKFVNVLKTQQVVRAKNVRIQSANHEIFTLECNKIALSAYDDKRFICDNGIDTLPYGHKDTTDAIFFNQISDDLGWGESEESEITESVEHYETGPDNSVGGENSVSLFELLETQFNPPDPGFNQREYTESELEDGGSIYEDKGSPEMYNCPFIDGEAVESDGGESVIIGRSGKRKRGSDSE